MAVDKNLEPFEVDVEGDPSESELKVEVVNPDAVSIETEDGGVVVDFEGLIVVVVVVVDVDVDVVVDM